MTASAAAMIAHPDAAARLDAALATYAAVKLDRGSLRGDQASVAVIATMTGELRVEILATGRAAQWSARLVWRPEAPTWARPVIANFTASTPVSVVLATVAAMVEL
jgi:hypothetical protein